VNEQVVRSDVGEGGGGSHKPASPSFLVHIRGGVQLNMGIDKRLCITVPEAAEMLGISRNYCYELVKRGLIPSIRLGKRILIPRAALEKMLEKGVKQCLG